MYVATINVPGYLPMDDDPPVFDTAAEAWQYLMDERERAINEAAHIDDIGTSFGDDQTWLVMRGHRDAGYTGSVYGFNPSLSASFDEFEENHDLGLAYSVTEVEE